MAGLASLKDSGVQLEAGPGGQLAVSVLLSLARSLGLKNTHDKVRKTLHEGASEIKPSRVSTAAGDDRLLSSIHEFMTTSRVNRDTKPARPWDDNTYIPEHLLCAAPFQTPLANLLIKNLSDSSLLEKRRPLLDAAVTFLSLSGMERFAEAWPLTNEELLPAGTLRDLIDTLIARQSAPQLMMRLLLAAADAELWERGIALLYHCGGDPGRQTARGLAALHPLPQPSQSSVRRQFSAAHRGTIWAAWSAHDTELLAIACERCLVPWSLKGSHAILPEAPPVFHRSLNTISAREQDGVDLAEFWRHVRSSQPQRVRQILNSVLKYAEADEFGRLLLEMECAYEDSPLQFFEEAILELLQSQQADVVSTGLTILSALPHAASKRTADAISLASQGLTSAQPLAKTACSALVAISDTFNDHREEVLEKLCFALATDNVAVLQQIIRALKHVRGSGKSALPLSRAATARLQDLAGNPKLQKPIQALI
jgi:hypothetical protein